MELIRQESNEWVFEDSTISHEVDEEFDAALEAADQGDLRVAERLARLVLRKCPDHIDALHHLALWLGERGDTLAAYVHCQAAVAIGLQAIPPDFNWKRSRLRWGYLENRPFMRAYQALALHRMDQRAWDDAILILGRLLAVNPNDNQGVRYELPKCWFETGDVDAVVEHCRAHRNDASPFIRYTNALALTMADRIPEGREALASAIRSSPLVARELLAKRHPEPDDGFAGSYVVGGPSEAWVYWDAYGTYWRRSKDAMKLLRELASVA